MQKYVAARAISGFLRIVGWIAVGAGVLIFIVGLSQLNSRDMYGVSMGPILLVGGLLTTVLGLIVVAIGEMMQVFIDTALDTNRNVVTSNRILKLMELVSGKSAPVFEEPVSEESPDQPSSSSSGKVVSNAVKEGYAWRKYEDGHIEADMFGRVEVFNNFDEFDDYVRQVGPASKYGSSA